MDQLPRDIILEICEWLGPNVKYFRATCTYFQALFEQNRARFEKRTCKIVSIESHYGNAIMFTNKLYPNIRYIIISYEFSLVNEPFAILTAKNKYIMNESIPLPQSCGSSSMFLASQKKGSKMFQMSGNNSIDYDFNDNEIKYLRINRIRTDSSNPPFVYENVIVPWQLTFEFYENILKYFIIGSELEKMLVPKFRKMIDVLQQFYKDHKFAEARPGS